jgi:hypothetical protein
MNKKPLIIIVLSIIYLLSPLFIIFQSSIIHNLPIIGYNSIFYFVLITDLLVLIIYPVCAVSIFLVKKWGWFTFIFSSLYLIIYNIIVYSLNPRYNIFIILFYNIILTVAAFIFFRKNVIAPYFNPRLRWWETDTRYRIDLSCGILIDKIIEKKFDKKSVHADILDISKTGSFIIPLKALILGKKYKVKINWSNKSSFFDVKVMRKAVLDQNMADKTKHKKEYGFGIMFINMTSDQLKFIDRMIAGLNRAKFNDSLRITYAKKTKSGYTAKRYKTRSRILFIKEKLSGSLIDFSRNGLFTCLKNKLKTGSIYDFRIACMNTTITAKGRIIREIKYKDQYGYGILFVDLNSGQKKTIKAAVRSLRSAGFKNRLLDAKPFPDEVIEKYAENTPYKIVLFLKNLFMAEK